MRKDEIVLVIDKSGSMAAIKDDAIGGFNSFIAEQRKYDRDASVTFALFDDRYQLVCNGRDIRGMEALTEETYRPSGMTALLDAVGRTIDRVGDRLDSLPESDKPENVIVFILTDGRENASSDYSRDKVREMIEHQESKYGWEFIYGGANQDAFSEAGGLGIKARNTFEFEASGQGTRRAFDESSEFVARYRNDLPENEPKKRK
ncbi:vWA domain-containing protein [Fodinibius sediminis]|uniref:von Willebrand factor type A domain-containing protein n=1 Tax=Fodinibius sediminis TaxID=1214077 RepID=A0A521BW54_9BACT|nr:vWA domain-containing protein [Fodinibius sediminis]SMO51423.1 hypothetical protein SAMN06265218_10491 [Fodinibius sediminis]